MKPAEASKLDKLVKRSDFVLGGQAGHQRWQRDKCPSNRLHDQAKETFK